MEGVMAQRDYVLEIIDDKGTRETEWKDLARIYNAWIFFEGDGRPEIVRDAPAEEIRNYAINFGIVLDRPVRLIIVVSVEEHPQVARKAVMRV